MPSVFIKTYGCQMNERDSEAVAAQLVAKGYTLVSSEAEADVILLNTCSVRDFAEQKALNKMVNVIAETRRSRPGVVRPRPWEGARQGAPGARHSPSAPPHRVPAGRRERRAHP